MYKKIYLATPYTGMEDEAYKTVNQVAGRLMEIGYIVFSPVTHGHTLATTPGIKLPLSHEFWLAQCEPFICDWAEEVFVLKLPGWEKSIGVEWETNLAKKLGIPVSYLEFSEGALKKCSLSTS